ncbi:hypothetical protein SAMN05216525_12548 [Bradyrhizobium sp. Gha]|nr:hypothetical protein SAMN05216525_12548 [Bradyrhizobium sp. Gha]
MTTLPAGDAVLTIAIMGFTFLIEVAFFAWIGLF